MRTRGEAAEPAIVKQPMWFAQTPRPAAGAVAKCGIASVANPELGAELRHDGLERRELVLDSREVGLERGHLG